MGSDHTELTTTRMRALRDADARPFGRVWDALTLPSSAVSTVAEQRRARFLSALLVIVVPISWFSMVIYLLTYGGEVSRGTVLLHFGVNLGVTAAYALSRTTRYPLAVGLAVAMGVGGSWLFALAETVPARVQTSSAFAMSGILLCAMFFPIRVTAGVGAVNLLAVLTILVVAPGISPDEIVWSLTVQALVTVMIVLICELLQQDLADLRARSRQLAESQERYSLAARGASDALWDWDLRRGSAYFSPRWLEMLGLPLETRFNGLEDWYDRVHPEDVERLREELDQHVLVGATQFENTHRVLHADGTYRWIQARGLAVRDTSGKAMRVAGSLTDITEQKLYEQQLLHDAFHDPLTGLPNRALFLNRLAHSVARARRRPAYLFAVLFLDLDRFKVINDSLGHELGDQLLLEMASRLKGCIRPGDTAARLGGDEFTILLDDMDDPRDATAVADRIQEALKPHFELAGHEVSSSVSIGIALSTTGYSRPENLIRDADTAMYNAKSAGRARYQVFDRRMHEDAVARLRLETDLSRALERSQFRVHYQPIVCLEDGRIDSFEALVRWEHPERGLVYPEEFIPVAEETGLINGIGWWVLGEACQRTAEWRSRFATYSDLKVNVNLSGRQFRQESITETIARALREAGLGPDCVRLEITESVVMENAQDSREVLAALQGQGIRLCIDDFGTGYSSLNYLHSFDIDVLKIDRSFVRRISRGHRPEIIETIIELSRSLNMSVTAEGLESKEQLAQLRELSCERAQGYYFSRPLEATEVERLLARDPRW